MSKRPYTMIRGPIGFTPVESRLAAALAMLVLLVSGIALYQLLTEPPPRVYMEVHTLSAAADDEASSRLPSTLPDTTPRAVRAPAAAKIDINTADYAELLRLPGIGPVLASRIIDYRDRHGPFRAVDSLITVPGIGPKKLDALRPHICVR